MKIEEKVNILGTDYNISVNTKPLERDADGLVCPYSKQLVICPVAHIADEIETTEGKEKAFKETVRHEVIHAFFMESGLPELSSNENVVNWLAIQFPKMQKTFEELGVEE